MKVLFSGRFDDPHPGHWATILKLMAVFDQVVVVILDYEGRQHTADYVKNTFLNMAMLSGLYSGKIRIFTNKTHFAKITMEEWLEYQCDWYAGGNEEVNKHMMEMGIPVYEQERTFDFSARYYKKKE